MDLRVFLPLLIVLLFRVMVLPYLSVKEQKHRYYVLYFTMVIGAYYLQWRFIETVWTAPLPTFQGYWIWLCFLFEVMVFFEIFQFNILMLKITDRKKEADLYEKVLRSIPKAKLPHVAVLIPTLSEGEDVLERTVLGCAHLDWPKNRLSIWVLDDGNRHWLRDMCAKWGVNYIRRTIRGHGKAGNLNHAMHVIKDAEFFACFDADFVPHRNFLYRTVGFFSDPKVAILQTPQHFFNRDFIQANLHIHDQALDDQRLFFDMIMPARDGWDASFWCGSCSVSRARVMKWAGGMSTDSVSEDILTTLNLLQHGYVTRYFNEKLSHGLAPESIEGLAVQRRRWCRGYIQCLYSDHGLFRGSLTFAQNLIFFPFYWLFNPITRFMSLFIPVVYFWTGIPALIVDHYFELIQYQIPFMAIIFFANFWYAPRHYMPVIDTAGMTLQAFHILPTMLHALIDPFGKTTFEVTPKGQEAKRDRFHKYSFLIALTFWLATFGGIVMHVLPTTRISVDDGFFPIAAFWGLVNMVILTAVLFLTVEHPRWRAEERFAVNEDFEAELGHSKKLTHVHCTDISTGGCALYVKQRVRLEMGEPISLHIADVGHVEGEIVNIRNHKINVKFIHANEAIKHALIRHIYTGRYDSAPYATQHGGLWLGFLNRIFGAHRDHEEHWSKVSKESRS